MDRLKLNPIHSDELNSILCWKTPRRTFGLLLAKVEATTMLQCFLRTKGYLLIVAFCMSTWAITGCIEAMSYLASDSRLPKWITLPPGLTRADVEVDEESMDPAPRGLNVKFVLRNKKSKKLAEASGKSRNLSGRYIIVVVNETPEIIGFTHQINEHGIDLPYFYVVDDPAIKKKLLDENVSSISDH